jgi:predicted Mrr-cat superfamily restriction endonuclease
LCNPNIVEVSDGLEDGMGFWVVRAGRHGETENYNIDRNIVAVGWHEFGDLSSFTDRTALKAHITNVSSESALWP